MKFWQTKFSKEQEKALTIFAKIFGPCRKITLEKKMQKIIEPPTEEDLAELFEEIPTIECQNCNEKVSPSSLQEFITNKGIKILLCPDCIAFVEEFPKEFNEQFTYLMESE